MASKIPNRVAVIGLDCAEPHLIEKHIKEGYLPTFKKLIEEGMIAENCLTPYPTVTPPNWAAIATGAWTGTHGITDFHLSEPGKTPDNSNIIEAFGSERLTAEYFWDALDKAGKHCVVVNYPGAWPSHMKNGIMVGGAGLTIGEMRDGRRALSSRDMLCADHLVSTAVYPIGIKAKFEDASSWQNLTEPGSDPLEMAFRLTFPYGTETPAPTTWYVLARQSGKNGYDRISLSPTKNFKEAFFTIRPGEWSQKAFAKIKMPDNSEREVFFRAKLLELSEDAQDFRLLISALNQVSGWTSPPEIAGELVAASKDGIFGHSGGLPTYSIGWFEIDTYVEINQLHDQWLGDVVTTLIKNHPCDLLYMHSHPPDWLYHVVLTDMDPLTQPDEAKRKQAWDTHLKIYQSQDKMLARIIEAAGPDTLFVLISDHGAVADGPMFNPYKALAPKGLAVMKVEEKRADPRANLRVGVTRELEEHLAVPDSKQSKALAQRNCHIYINLKGRDPEGIVEPADYEKTQQEILDALLTYTDPVSGKRVVSLALSKQDARILGLYGDRMGDVIYAIYPEFGSQHAQQLPAAEWGIGSLKGLLTMTGPGIRKGLRLERTAWLPDLVPTICYLMSWPLPAQAEGAVLYQVFKEPNFKMEEVSKLKDTLSRMENALSSQKES